MGDNQVYKSSDAYKIKWALCAFQCDFILHTVFWIWKNYSTHFRNTEFGKIYSRWIQIWYFRIIFPGKINLQKWLLWTDKLKISNKMGHKYTCCFFAYFDFRKMQNPNWIFCGKSKKWETENCIKKRKIFNINASFLEISKILNN